MKKLIVNADDFGYRPDINRGIIYAHQNGIVTSSSLFVNRPGTEEAVALAREHPQLGIGIHIDVDDFFEVDHTLGVISGWKEPRAAVAEIAAAVSSQIERFLSFGFLPDHMDSHHNAHVLPELSEVFCEMASRYKIPFMRCHPRMCPVPGDFQRCSAFMEKAGIRCVTHFIEGWYWGNVDEQFEVAELMTHPGYGELWREAEMAHCCQPNLKSYLASQQIDLVRFRDLL